MDKLGFLDTTTFLFHHDIWTTLLKTDIVNRSEMEAFLKKVFKHYDFIFYKLRKITDLNMNHLKDKLYFFQKMNLDFENRFLEEIDTVRECYPISGDYIPFIQFKWRMFNDVMQEYCDKLIA